MNTGTGMILLGGLLMIILVGLAVFKKATQKTPVESDAPAARNAPAAAAAAHHDPGQPEKRLELTLDFDAPSPAAGETASPQNTSDSLVPVSQASPSTPVPSASNAPAPVAVPDGARVKAARTGTKVDPTELIDEVTQGLTQIPPLPQAMHQLLRELQNSDATSKSVARIISSDPGLATGLLRLANSAAMGLTREIVAVDEAVSYVGFSAVKALALKIKLGKILGSSVRGGYSAEDLLKHSYTVGMLAEYLSKKTARTEPWLASTLGLLHDIGKLAINTQFPKEVCKMMSEPALEIGESFLVRETRYFGADHAVIGSFLAHRWELPENLVECIRLHHNLTHPDVQSLKPEIYRTLLVVSVANQLTKYCHVYCADMEIDILPDEIVKELGYPEDITQLLDNNARNVVANAIMQTNSLTSNQSRGN